MDAINRPSVVKQDASTQRNSGLMDPKPTVSRCTLWDIPDILEQTQAVVWINNGRLQQRLFYWSMSISSDLKSCPFFCTSTRLLHHPTCTSNCIQTMSFQTPSNHWRPFPFGLDGLIYIRLKIYFFLVTLSCHPLSNEMRFLGVINEVLENIKLCCAVTGSHTKIYMRFSTTYCNHRNIELGLRTPAYQNLGTSCSRICPRFATRLPPSMIVILPSRLLTCLPMLTW